MAQLATQLRILAAPVVILVRPDGSALVTQRAGGWELTDLRSGQSTAVPVVEGEQLLASVVLR